MLVILFHIPKLIITNTIENWGALRLLWVIEKFNQQGGLYGYRYGNVWLYLVPK